MEIDIHLLDLKYESIKCRRRKTERRLLSSLIEQGQLSPIIVLPGTGEPPGYIVVDGFKRIRALRQSCHDTVKAIVWHEDEVSALIGINHLQRSVDRTALDDAYLIKTLQDFHRLSYEEIGRRLGRSKSWVGRRLGLITDLPSWIQDQIREGVVQCYTMTKYILPLARANPKDARKLIKNIRSLNLSTRDIGELYAAWRDGDVKGRNLVINHPRVVLRARRLNDVSDPKSVVLNDLEHILSLSHRLLLSWDQLLVSDLDPSEIKEIIQTWQAIQNNIEELDKKIKAEVLSHEKCGNAGGDSQTT